jgi:hypothetical protein
VVTIIYGKRDKDKSIYNKKKKVCSLLVIVMTILVAFTPWIRLWPYFWTVRIAHSYYVLSFTGGDFMLTSGPNLLSPHPPGVRTSASPVSDGAIIILDIFIHINFWPPDVENIFDSVLFLKQNRICNSHRLSICPDF